MRICVHDNYWSKTINLESVGINTQAHTYAPVNPVGRASRVEMDVMMEDVIKFENQFPIQPGVQVPGRKRDSSRMYALLCFPYCFLERTFAPARFNPRGTAQVSEWVSPCSSLWCRLITLGILPAITLQCVIAALPSVSCMCTLTTDYLACNADSTLTQVVISLPQKLTAIIQDKLLCFVFRLLPQPASPRSKKFKGPAGLPLSTPIIDPGHLLTKLNPDLAQKRCKRHEFSLETCLGPTIFHRTKVCSLYQPSSCLCFSCMLLSQSLPLLCFADFSCSIASPQHHVKEIPLPAYLTKLCSTEVLDR